jgi:hypothetical protein
LVEFLGVENLKKHLILELLFLKKYSSLAIIFNRQIKRLLCSKLLHRHLKPYTKKNLASFPKFWLKFWLLKISKKNTWF